MLISYPATFVNSLTVLAVSQSIALILHKYKLQCFYLFLSNSYARVCMYLCVYNYVSVCVTAFGDASNRMLDSRGVDRGYSGHSPDFRGSVQCTP